jgi:DNA-directed RNA polymerase specialized sigma24 family protein
MEQVGAGGLDNAEILSLVAKAVSPLTQRSNPARVLQAVYATITLEECLTLRMLFADQMTVEQIAQRQGRPVETVRSEIARSCARIRVYQPTDLTGQ